MAEGLPATMRAVLLTGFGGPEMLEVRSDVPVPQPRAGEVLVKVAAAAVNNTDINTRIGWYSKAVEAATDAGSQGFAEAQEDGWSGAAFTFPRIQGADCCGRIAAVGAGVDASRIGERVLIDPVLRGDDGEVRYFGSEVDGAFAEFTCVPARNALRVESHMGDTELASLPCAYSTAENILTRIGLAAGERVLITGASGGVGGAAVQLAKRRAAHVIAIASAEKAEAVRVLGADEIIGRNDPLTDLGPVDAVVDVVGGVGFAGLLDALRPGGRYGGSGAIAGPIVSLDLRTLYLKDLRLIGCTVLEPEVFSNLIGSIERGEIRPVVDAVFPLDQIGAAQAAFAEKRHVGKIVLRV